MWRRKQKSQAPQELTSKEIAALIEAAQLNENDIRQWHRSFLDNNPSGLVTKAEFIKQYQKLLANVEPQISLENIFDMIDRNNDGAVDFNEVLVMIVLMSRFNSVKSRLAYAFDMWDESGEGQIDPTELADVISAIYDRMGVTDRKGEQDPKKRAKEIIDKLDMTGDRKLSKEEFVEGCENDPVLRNLFCPFP